MRPLFSVCFLFSAACASDAADPADSDDLPGTLVSEVPPTTARDLRAWLDEGAYLDWAAESAPHASAGPHFGDVQTYVNAAFEAAALAGDTHPVGSASVKELFGSGDTVLGHAVMVKVAPGTAADSWYWFERYQGNNFANGEGDPLCVDCHVAGNDHVLTPFPLQ